jgi:NAD(P)-dependent dehydrogenase (short-subunit alcohol dehydrogenase family)/acyl carrier protein
VELLVLSSGLYKVHGDETVDPDNALLIGPCKTIPAEYSYIQCRNIDLNPDDDGARLVSLLRQEPMRPRTGHGIAYRKGYRWEQHFEPAKLPPAADQIRAGGVYLITGGMGGIGLTLARYFASFQARIALIGRNATPPREEWDAWLESHSDDDAVSERIRQMRDLEARGATVLPLAADVSDVNQMREAIDAIHRRLGPIEGIVHAAGVADGGIIQLKTTDAAERVLAPKVEGTRILHELTSQDPLKFVVLCSSVNALAGVPGAVAYTSANAFLDAYASGAEDGDGPVVSSIAWDAWQEVGMAVNTPVPREMRAARLASLRNAIKPEEGVEAFRRILGARLPLVAVLTSDKLKAPLPTIESMGQWSSPKQDGKWIDRADANEEDVSDRSSGAPFEAPQTEAERTIAKIWKDALGQSQIGLDDNFFDLGGHSLVGTSILSQIRTAFQVNLPLRLIFEAPTVRALAKHVETLRWNASTDTAGDAAEDREEIEI